MEMLAWSMKPWITGRNQSNVAISAWRNTGWRRRLFQTKRLLRSLDAARSVSASESGLAPLCAARLLLKNVVCNELVMSYV